MNWGIPCSMRVPDEIDDVTRELIARISTSKIAENAYNYHLVQIDMRHRLGEEMKSAAGLQHKMQGMDSYPSATATDVLCVSHIQRRLCKLIYTRARLARFAEIRGDAEKATAMREKTRSIVESVLSMPER